MKNLIVPLVCILFGIGLIYSCKKDPVIPTVITNSLSNITLNSVSAGGDITSNGGEEVTARGVSWSITRNPTIAGSHTVNGSGTGSFTCNLTDLTPNTMYYVKAYATNSVGTAYGEEVSFTTTPIVIPTLTTTAVTSIALTTAVSGGEITVDGGGAITSRGVCWATTANPTISNSKTTDGTGTGSFISNLTGLLPATTYYIRSYATNSAGTAYGTELSFTSSPIIVATLTTTAVTSVTLTTAVSGGNITANGGGDITAKGTCWSTTPNPTISNSKTTDGTGTGIFISNLTGLQPGTTYYVRSYASNSAGTAYGNEISFTTTPIGAATLTTNSITLVTLTTAVSGGNITADGGGSISVRGVCWSTTTNPTVSNSKTTDGTGIGSFISNLTNLLPGTKYYVKAYATNSSGTAYGDELSFTTKPVEVATLTTNAVTSITLTTAVSGGNITADGGGSISARGVCWSTTATPTISGSHTTNGTGTGSFTSNLTPLLPGTTYYVRSYATNSAGTAYGNEVSFVTGQIVVATVTTTSVTSITLTTAVSGGNITADGGGTISARGVCWSTSADPVVTGSHTTNGTGTGAFVSTLSSLSPGTTYHVRAYATNSAGTAYGSDVSFSTPIAFATLSTTAISSIDQTTAVSGGNITSDGGSALSARGVCWATTEDPTVGGSHSTDGTATGVFTSNLTGLTAGTTYYVRAYATNSAGTAYGNQLSFKTINETGTVSDSEGNTYNTVKIGTQWWMAENLRTTEFNNGDPIANIQGNAEWAGDSILFTPAYCWYNNNSTYRPIYGALYNWFAIDEGNLCPTGWHVPTDAEFNTLELYLGIPQSQIDVWGWRGTDQGDQMKTTTGWSTGNGTNSSGFSGLPGGYRFAATGTFNDLGNITYWWTSTSDLATTAWYRRLDGGSGGSYKAATQRRGGKYVRCLKN